MHDWCWTGSPPKSMSPRRTQWLELRAGGLTAPEVAEAMCISQSGERAHKADVLFFLHARTVPHAVAIGYQRGILKV